MRITNNMMLRNASSNINGNKVNVDSLNSQMTSQKKIQRPSEDPVIAIRALRYRSTVSEYTQYYENNIEDAEGWLETTETSLNNIMTVLSDIRNECEYGASDQITTQDRNTILSDLKKLRDQIYSEGNTDYAGRTIFTGYRTNQTLTFSSDDKTTTYDINQSLSFEDLDDYNYFGNSVSMATLNSLSGTAMTAADGVDDDDMPTEFSYSRLRLAYTLGSGDSITGIGNPTPATASTITPTVPAGYTYGTTSPNSGTNPAMSSSTYGIFLSYTPTVSEPTSYAAAAAADPALDVEGQAVEFPVLVYDTMDDALADAVTDIDGNAQLGFPESTLTYAASSGSGSGNVTQGGAIFIKETGELIMSDALAQDIRSSQATLNIEYTKTGFDSGEAKPEYYFNCTKTTADGKTVNYTKYDENGNEIDQDINYLVASSQSLTVNTEASDILTTDIARDVDEMIEAMTRSLEAIQKVDDITEMQGLSTYSSSGAQDALATWLAAAEKERDYANANLQQLYNKYIGNFDSYVEKVNLAITDVGSKGVSLSLTKNRVSNQLSTVKELQSNNEDRDLSDIILDYTSAYTAYEASLQAAATLNQTTLLNYL